MPSSPLVPLRDKLPLNTCTCQKAWTGTKELGRTDMSLAAN